jgi:hypothetical protein
MADEFDAFLKDALAPPAGDADRLFVAKVQAHIRVEDELERERTALLSKFGKELVALLAIAAGIALLARSPIVLEWAAGAPGVAIGALLATFFFVVGLFAGGSGAPSASLRLRRS